MKTKAINMEDLFKDLPKEHFQLNTSYDFKKLIKTAYGIKNKKDELVSAVKNSYERSKYGVSSRDAWSLGDYILVSLSNGLRILARDAHGWPGTEEFPTFEDWQMKLIEVAEALESTIVDEDEDIPEWKKYKVTRDIYGAEHEYTQKAREVWLAALDEEQTRIKKTRKDAFKWIATHCDQLWD